MIDQVLIHIKSGQGGDGAISGRHEKFVPRGGPEGGAGRKGGSVIFMGDSNENTLLRFRYKRVYAAGNGGNGASAKKHGSDGRDVIIKVPVGTQIWGEEDLLIGDITENGQELIAAIGGSGGYGNVKYASSTNQFPVIAQSGEEGVQRAIRLELKLIADVGIIGAPNAGKSSLITYLTAATPKIADYPFTTLEPVLGVVEHRAIDFVMVDIPGIIEGANQGIGLGHEFLRHVERTKVLIHLVDGSGEDPSGEFRKITEELRLFDEGLVLKPVLFAINKIDLDEVRILLDDILESMGDKRFRFHVISAVTGEGVGDMMDAVVQILVSSELDKSRSFPPLSQRAEHVKPSTISQPVVDVSSIDNIPVLRPVPRQRGVAVHVENDVFVVESPGVGRIADRIDYEDWMARMQFYKHLQKTGVVKALEEAGIQHGDTVRIGAVEWDWD
ncbi:MAG: GTPase ObgE [Chloroflexota bacterium]|nr:GTPase ObgE [Chloroflexota bacterium]